MLIKSVCDNKISIMVDKIIAQDHMGEYLSMLAKFPQMPYENILLLMNQIPDAVAVCGKGAWWRYCATVREGQKPAALFGPVIKMTNYEDEDEIENEDEELDNIISYDVVPVYDISQTETKSMVSDICTQPALAKSFESIIIENYIVQILDDVDSEVLNGKIIKSKYRETDKTIYLLPGLNDTVRNTELLHQYAVLCVNKFGITDFADVLDHYMTIVLGKYFIIPGTNYDIYYSELFSASQSEKRKFLQNLSSIVFYAVCELSGKKLLSFNDTIFCNLLFDSDDMSDALSNVGAYAEMPDTEDIHNDLISFLGRMHDIDEKTYKHIRFLRERQLLFTFPPVNITGDDIKGSTNSSGVKQDIHRNGADISL